MTLPGNDPDSTPSCDSAAAGWTAPRIAAPRNGPAAMPRNVRAAMRPRARGRPTPGNRCEAAEVATGTSAPPPTAWRSRAAIRTSRVGAMPASRLPTVNTTSAQRNTRRVPRRSARRPARGIVTTDTRR